MSKEIKYLKIQIDIGNKVIKFEGNYNLRKVMKIIKKILPTNWVEFSINTSPITNWEGTIHSDIRRWWRYNFIPYHENNNTTLSPPWTVTCENTNSTPPPQFNGNWTSTNSTHNLNDVPKIINIEL